MTTSVEFLRSVQLFSYLDDNELSALNTLLRSKTVAAGKSVVEYGESGDTMYVIEQGKVRLTIRDTTGDTIVLSELGPTDVFGELAIFDPGPRSATVTVVEDVQLLVLHRDDLLRFLRATPAAALDLLAVLAHRLREANQLLMGRVTRNLNTAIEQDLSTLQRVANWIAEFSGSMLFLLLNAAFFAIWILINLEVIPGVSAFDPYPFGFLTMSVSLEAIFLSIFVLLSQNIQSAKERIRNDVEYEINLKAELEVAELHGKMYQLQTELSRRFISLEDQLKASGANLGSTSRIA